MSDLVNRLRGLYRIPITDGLGPAGGLEPDNAKEFVRQFETVPIQHEAANRIADLEAQVARLRELLEPFAKEACLYEDACLDSHYVDGCLEITVGELRKAAAALEGK